MTRIVVAGFAIAALAAGFVACKQGKGDRCQVNADCQDGLLCSSATGTCVGSGATNEIDATVPPMDGRLDAAPDARPDAPRDAPRD
jgi:hypothetical protein